MLTLFLFSIFWVIFFLGPLNFLGLPNFLGCLILVGLYFWGHHYIWCSLSWEGFLFFWAAFLFGIVLNHWLVIIFWGKVVKKGSNCVIVGHIGPDKAKWGRTGPNRTKRNQTGPNGAKRGQTGPNGACFQLHAFNI